MRTILWRLYRQKIYSDGTLENVDGRTILLEDIKQAWASDEDAVDICIRFRMTLPMLENLKLPKRPGERRPPDPTPEEIEQISEKIQRTWTPEIKASRRGRREKDYV